MVNARARADTTGTMKSELNIGRKDREMGCLPLLKSGRDFFSQAYDREKGELWGRTAVSWGLILAFYLVFYTVLIGGTAGLLKFWERFINNADSVKYSGPEEGLAWTPGVSHIPIWDPEKKSTLIRFSRANDDQCDNLTNYMYDSFLEGYEPIYWSSENGNFIDCSSGRTDPDVEKVCEFKLDALRPCIKEDGYGWGDGQPCIILKMNKINNWVPENYAPDEVPDEIKDVWKPDVITVKCFGADPVSRELLGDIEYTPQQGWSFDYFPFTGQQGYKSPLVAAQFMSLPPRTLVFITCKAYTKNMVYHQTYGLGQTRFELISD